jgi:hypothetical protein
MQPLLTSVESLFRQAFHFFFYAQLTSQRKHESNPKVLPTYLRRRGGFLSGYLIIESKPVLLDRQTIHREASVADGQNPLQPRHDACPAAVGGVISAD